MPSKVGKYEILRLLGQGGMGLVYLARDPANGRELAVKTLSALGNTGRRRLQREFRIMARLNHPGLVAVYDYGAADGAPYFVMEYVNGANLKMFIGPPAPDSASEQQRRGRIVALGRELCRILSYIHGCGVVHRDIKPGNVLVAQDGKVKLMDFGLVHTELSSVSLTEEGGLVGTATYMSPEQITGKRVDQRSDIYALGVVLFELVTGKAPFSGPGFARTVWQHLHDEPPRVGAVVAEVSPELEQLVASCLAKDAAARPQRAESVEKALAECPEHELAPTAESLELSASARLRQADFLFDPDLTGREGEMQSLLDHVARLVVGTGGVVAVTGEPGVGKSRLVGELIEHLADFNVTAVVARCLEDVNYPFEAVHSMLTALADGAARGDLPAPQRLFGDRGAALRRVCPRLGAFDFVRAQPDPPRLSPAQEKLRIFELLAMTLEELCASRPTVLVVEDLQWADELSHECLAHLGHTLIGSGRAALLLVLTYTEERSREARALAQWTGSLRRLTCFRQIALTCLDVAGVAELVRSMLGMDQPPMIFATRLHEETDGNPFFVQEMVKSLLEVGLLSRGPDGFWQIETSDSFTSDPTLSHYRRIPLPQSIRDVVQRRVMRVSEPAREILQRAAVLGPELDFELLLAVAECSEDELMNRLDELLDSSLLQEVSGKEEVYRFTHAKVREVAYESLAPRRRRRAHRRAAEALVGREARDPGFRAVVARHFALSGMPSEAIAWLVEAGTEAADVAAFKDAVEHFNGAFSLAVDRGEEASEALLHIHQRRGSLYARLGCLDEADLDLACGLLLARRLGRVSLAALLLVEQSYVAYLRGNPDQTIARATEAAELAGEVDDPRTAARIENALGIAHGSRGFFKEAINHYSKAAMISEQIGDEGTLAANLGNIGINYQLLGRLDQALEFFSRSLEMGRRAGNRGLECSTLCNMAATHLQQNQIEVAAHAYQQALDIATRLGLRADEIEAELGMGRCELARGAWAAAMQRGGKACELAKELGNTVFQGTALRLLAQATAARGTPEPLDADIDALFAESIRVLGRTGERNELADSHLEYALWLHSRHRGAAAASQLEAARGLYRELGMKSRLAHLEALLSSSREDPRH
ncbi:MAG: protein kinase [Candidatus Schekmanbacteria bacterium]|nr:protein kinase [Candidatus Schekmanbacteria bacterium]